MKDVIRIAVKGAQTIPYNKLVPFQDDIKRIEKEQYEKLRKAIIEQGFSFTIHVWKNKGKNYIIDGHQRLFTVKQMANVEGWKVPALPVSIVEAKNFAEAKRKVLAGASQYGTFDENNLLKFLDSNDIPFDEVVATFDFPEVDMMKLGEGMEKIEDLPETKSTGGMKVSSDDVHQVQLYFDSKSHEQFMSRCEALATEYKTENISDTVLAAINEEYNRKA